RHGGCRGALAARGSAAMVRFGRTLLARAGATFVGRAASSGPPATAIAIDYGPDTCREGYVWREACGTYDHVCVTPAARAQAAQDNAQATARREPNGGPYGAETCKPGFVWREACDPDDHVCVTPQTRSEAHDDNEQALGRAKYPYSVVTERNDTAPT